MYSPTRDSVEMNLDIFLFENHLVHQFENESHKNTIRPNLMFFAFTWCPVAKTIISVFS